MYHIQDASPSITVDHGEVKDTKYKFQIPNTNTIYLSMTVEHGEVGDDNRHWQSNNENLPQSLL